MLRICILLLLLISSHFSLYSQDSITNVVTPDKKQDKDYLMLQIKLPPLSKFFKNIHTHPSVGIYETYKEEALANLGEEKQKWLDYLRVVANYQYGKNYTFTENTNTTENLLLSSDKATNNYSLGVAVAIPIGNLTSRNKRIKSQKAILKRVQYEYELAVEERKFMILEAYNTVMEQLATIKSKSESVALYNAQIKISEDDFKMGEIDLIGLSLERSRRVAAIVSYEEAKVSLYNAIILLEMLSDVKMLNK